MVARDSPRSRAASETVRLRHQLPDHASIDHIALPQDYLVLPDRPATSVPRRRVDRPLIEIAFGSKGREGCDERGAGVRIVFPNAMIMNWPSRPSR
jgi:hypothetical protein